MGPTSKGRGRGREKGEGEEREEREGGVMGFLGEVDAPGKGEGGGRRKGRTTNVWSALTPMPRNRPSVYIPIGLQQWQLLREPGWQFLRKLQTALRPPVQFGAFSL